jgi:hypothetical protein
MKFDLLKYDTRGKLEVNVSYLLLILKKIFLFKN